MYLKIFPLRDKMRDIEDIVTGARASYWSLICHELRRDISHRQRAFVFISISIANFGSLRYGALLAQFWSLQLATFCQFGDFGLDSVATFCRIFKNRNKIARTGSTSGHNGASLS